jgi:hypothetical protein
MLNDVRSTFPATQLFASTVKLEETSENNVVLDLDINQFDVVSVLGINVFARDITQGLVGRLTSNGGSAMKSHLLKEVFVVMSAHLIGELHLTEIGELDGDGWLAKMVGHNGGEGRRIQDKA